MVRVSFISGGSLKDVRRVTLIPRSGAGGARTVRHIYQRDDEDAGDALRVRVVRPGLGVVERLRVYRVPSGRRKRQSLLLRPLERRVRRLAKRELEIAADYLSRHERSNRRKSNGWIRDLRRNVVRSIRTDR
jgi:hypothetical protein